MFRFIRGVSSQTFQNGPINNTPRHSIISDISHIDLTETTRNLIEDKLTTKVYLPLIGFADHCGQQREDEFVSIHTAHITRKPMDG